MQKTLTRGRRRNRNRIEIIYDILSGIEMGEIKTHIMFKANLSYDMLVTYLSFLLERGLIEKVSEGKVSACLKSPRKVTLGAVYKVTPKGWRFIQAFEQLESIARIDS